MPLMNPLSKSWLFEVVNTKTKQIVNSFTLILPPQSYTIREKQRVSITKTFGNAFIDDYGPDNIEITIKGISGTAHVFPTYRPKGPAGSVYDTTAAVKSDRALVAQYQGVNVGGEGYTGKGAFYTFRNDIMRYKDGADFENMELHVYDLADEQSYKCVLLEFAVDRTKDQPFWYPFTISLFVYAKLDSKAAARPKPIVISADPILALDKIEENIRAIQVLYQQYQTVIGAIAKVKTETTNVRTKINNFTSRVRNVLESPLVSVKYLYDTLIATGGIVYDIYNQGRMLIENYAGAKELIEDSIRSALRIYGFSISEGTQTSKELYVEQDAGLDIDADSVVTKAVAEDTFLYDGLASYTVKGDETLQSIALEALGDSSLWVYIAEINNIGGNDEISSGDQIYIPRASASDEEDTRDSFIITEDTNRDPYGADIRLDEDGNLVVSASNDVSIITGLENIMQAVDMRLATIQGSLIKQTAFGILAGAGLAGTALTLSYLRMSIRSSLLEDPRIAEIKNLRISWASDVIQASMDISVIGYDESLPVTTTI